MTDEELLRGIIERAVHIRLAKFERKLVADIMEQIRRAGIRVLTNRPPNGDIDDDD